MEYRKIFGIFLNIATSKNAIINSNSKPKYHHILAP